jgi:hypothetical protein
MNRDQFRAKLNRYRSLDVKPRLPTESGLLHAYSAAPAPENRQASDARPAPKATVPVRPW